MIDIFQLDERQCTICGCTEFNACRLETGEACCWTSRSHSVDLCNNPRCIVAYELRLKAEKLAMRVRKENAVKPIRKAFQLDFVQRRAKREAETARRARGMKPHGRIA